MTKFPPCHTHRLVALPPMALALIVRLCPIAGPLVLVPASPALALSLSPHPVSAVGLPRAAPTMLAQRTIEPLKTEHRQTLTRKTEDRADHVLSGSVHLANRQTEPEEEKGWEWAAPRLALLAMAGSCGTNFPLIHIVEESISPSQATFLRFTCATLPFLPLLAQRLSALEWDLRADKTMLPGLEIGAWCALGYVTQAIGLAQTAPAKGAFICALFMVITPLINGLAGRRVELQAYLAVAIALAGTAVLEGLVPGVGEASAGGLSAFNAGDAWCFGTAVGFGAMFARMEMHMERLDDADLALPLTAWQLVAMLVATAAWHAADGGLAGGAEQWLQQVQAASGAQPLLLPALLWMGLVTGAGVLWGETIALKKVPSTEAGVIFATEPLWAAGFAALLLHDAIAPNELLGGAAIVLACLCLQLPEATLLALGGGGEKDAEAGGAS